MTVRKSKKLAEALSKMPDGWTILEILFRYRNGFRFRIVGKNWEEIIEAIKNLTPNEVIE